MYYYGLSALILLGWYLCGIVNIASVQATQGDGEFDYFNRNTNLVLCFGLGPVLTVVFFGWGLVKQPIRLGTCLGRYIGRKFEKGVN